MIVRVYVACTHGDRRSGPYLVDSDEARELAAAGVLEPRLEAVVPQVGVDDADVVDATTKLAAALFQPAPQET